MAGVRGGCGLVVGCLIGIGVICAVVIPWAAPRNALVSISPGGKRAALEAKLKRLLLSERDTYQHTQRVLHTRQVVKEKSEEHHRSGVHRKWTKEELDRAACHDGGPCKINQMPIMKYIPSTGNWDIVQAGNPQVIWDHLMSKARARDEYADAQKPVRRTVPEDPLDEKSLQTQSLLMIGGGVDGADEAEHQRLEERLKSLLQNKVARGLSLRHMASPGRPENEEEASKGEDSKSQDSPTVRWAYKIASDLKDGQKLAQDGRDVQRMERLINTLGDTESLHRACRHPALAHNILGVWVASSLSGCVRQIRGRMEDTRQALKARVGQIRYTSADSSAPKLGSAGGDLVLSDNKKLLTTQLNTLRQNHDKLQEQLEHQERRMASLAREKQEHRGLPSTEQGSPMHAHAAKAGAFAVPPGLPPGYEGQLLKRGATALPETGIAESADQK